MLLVWMSYFVPEIAQSNQPVNHNLNTSNSQNIEIHFQDKEPDGSRRGRPNNRVGTGSRGDCPSVNVPIIALIPEKNVGLTVDDNPSFWFFVPYKSQDTPVGKFVLQNEADEEIYQTKFTLPKTPGFVSLTVPSTVPLELNKDHQWYFKLYCSRQRLLNPIFVRGWVQKIAIQPNLKGLLKSTTKPRQHIAIYAENGIWYSALSELAKLRLNEPKNPILAKDWANLLEDVGLANIASQPIVGEVIEENR
ncbi:MAG: DUF928 domain-containing protein [Pelatocladus maniniholoensis HA4357-MV3]|uniref:DUF928 domain-containing protein n=1 Tax=Pelatocladus maniniholoensis HA4357-MV3 TaxID=1117104 RepID=A0A9E3H6E2_9NOST|nr:DUF928 domain-containing protein [Pelatocladus maniniholoensis HA4357-MV3]